MKTNFSEASARLGHQRAHAALHRSLSTQHLSRPFTSHRPALAHTRLLVVTSSNFMSASERQTSSSDIMQVSLALQKLLNCSELSCSFLARGN